MSTLTRAVRAVCSQISGALLLQSCTLCASPSGDAPVCSDCRNDLPGLGSVCPCCSLPSPGEAVCGECLRSTPPYDATHGLWRYAYPSDRLIHDLKFRSRFALARFFGTELAACFPVGGADVIVPMPLHPARLAERGFNQSAEIARHLASSTRTPILVQAATRLRATLPQANLAHAERARNVRNAFRATVDLRGVRVAVVDDVMTSGATLGALAAALKHAGASRVDNWIVTRTMLHV